VVIELDTLRTLHEHGYRLSVFCRPCGRHAFLDLPALIAVGEGGRGRGLARALAGGRGELFILWDRLRRSIP
jgi:hypothetical protein